MKNYLFILLLVVSSIACESSNTGKTKKSEYSVLNNGIKFKYIQFGEGEALQSGDLVMVNILITDTLLDTLYYVGDYPYIFKLKEDQLSVALSNRKIGDSVVYQLQRKALDQFYTFDNVLKNIKPNSEIKVFFRLIEIVDAKHIDAVQEEILFHRKLKEQNQLTSYLKKKTTKKIDTLDGGVYRIIEQHNPKGELIQKGSSITLEYIGKLIDGYEFENTYKKMISPIFQYGEDFQLIEGIEIGLEGLKSGEKVKIILSSQHAFGKEGSLAGIVPPYTAVIFEINIKKVAH